ncbi:MAG: phosphate transport regulator, partial [Bryobacteraceae bacterium]
MKTQVLEAIGETELKCSAEVNAAFAANDRIKYYLTLLQMAASRCDNPDQPAGTLRRERLACGIDDPGLDDIAAGSRRENGKYRLPGWVHIRDRITQDLRLMAAPVLPERDRSGPRGTFSERLESLLNTLPPGDDDLINANLIAAVTHAGRGADDSIHQIVMDLHKALNAMQKELAQEQIDGAAVYHIDEADRSVIAAFMAGLNRTAPLKFNHPGLGTTATRSGSKLVIQNDIGTTDAHVLVIHIENLNVELTYTDVHPERVEFLREMLKPFAVIWERDQTRQTDNLASGEAFRLAIGRFEAKDREQLLTYVDFLGSRLVFLIDWNRARKQLRGFLNDKQRFELLAWAAKEDIGHRGFLEAGGPRLINQAIEETAGSAMHFGDRLCDVLGNDAALDFVRFVFQSATQALRDHQSSGLLRDRIRAELQAHFSSEG